MTLVIEKNIETPGIINAVKEISGVDISSCLQCKKCTNGCPLVNMVDTPPSDIIRKLQLKAGDELLESKLVWMCASCETCFSRCPMKIDMAAVMDAMQILASKKKIAFEKDEVKKMNESFLNSVRLFGRTYDIGMIMGFKLKTMNLMQDSDKMPAMLFKRKIAFFPNIGSDKRSVRQIFKRTRKSEQE
jgi:heterodisulfide reductase subunit C2